MDPRRPVPHGLALSRRGTGHDATVGGFWIDEYAVTNADFAAFVAATGYVTLAERAPDPTAYPGAQPELLKPGSTVFFMPTGRINMREITSRWAHVPSATTRRCASAFRAS
jgi:formylglycine-generating enzyme